MTTIASTITARQLWEMPNHERFELVQGELVPMSPPGFDHGCIVSDIAAILRQHVRARRLGVVAVEAGFYIAHDPDTVRSPDVAFVRAERVPAGGVRAFFDGAPDLAVEVVSPYDRPGEVMAKAREWIESGCSAVWVIEPETKTAVAYARDRQPLFLSPADSLSCEELLPGFRLPLAEVFGG